MQKKSKQHDFVSRTGTGMIVVAWIVFLVLLYTIFEDQLLQRNNPNQNIVTTVNGLQKEVVLQRNVYGHYVTSGTINNHPVTFLLDTGATDVAIPESVAEKIGLQKGRTITVKTANGTTRAYRTRLDHVAISDIRLDNLNATILTNITGHEVLLGMSFLKHFEIVQKGRSLTIRQ